MKGLKANLNDRIEIIWGKKIYKSTVQDVSNDSITINIPASAMGYLPAKVGELLNIMHYQKDGEVYQYSEQVQGRTNDGRLSYIVYNFPEKVKKLQRRDYVRVQHNQIIKYVKENAEQDIKVCKKGFLMDLSGGGMKIKVKENIRYGDKITTIISYGNYKLQITGSVVRSETDDQGEKVYGIAFDEINNAERDKIIKIVFNIMRKQREIL